MNSLLLITYRPTADGKAVTAQAIVQQPDITHLLRVKGSVDFEVYNTGTVSFFLFENIEILPTESWTPRKSTPLPFSDDIPLRWSDNYDHSKIIGDVILPPPNEVPK